MREDIIKSLMKIEGGSRKDALKCRKAYLESEISCYDEVALKEVIQSMKKEIEEISIELENYVTVKYVGIDDWNRPVFKDVNSENYYGSVDKLFSYEDNKWVVQKKISEFDLCYFGTSFGCEPWGGPLKKIINIEW